MPPNRDGSPPQLNLWSISGSAAWRNKADYGLIIRRDDMSKNEPILSVQKIKQKSLGKVGEIQLYYNYQNGLMKDHLNGEWEMPKR